MTAPPSQCEERRGDDNTGYEEGWFRNRGQEVIVELVVHVTHRQYLANVVLSMDSGGTCTTER